MGMNTAALILNDQLDELERDGAGEDIARAIQARDKDAAKFPVRGVKLLPCEHADTIQIIAVGGNTIRMLGHGHWKDDDEALLRKLAAQLGYRIVPVKGPKLEVVE